MVAPASAVSVLVIDCTVMGASPPTSTEPTRILRQGRRWIIRQGRWEFGSADMGAYNRGATVTGKAHLARAAPEIKPLHFANGTQAA